MDDIKTNIVENYPYLASSSRLIEAFVIIGYNKELFDCQENFKKLDKKTGKFEEYIIEDESPSIITSIINDYSDIPMNLDIVPKLIFPNKEPFYNISKMDNEDTFLFPYSVISYFNNDSLKGDCKITLNYYAYVFFEIIKLNNNNITLAVKNSFCIISQYPYFNFYYNLLAQLHQLMKREVDFPLEIFMHNIVNYIPSPLNNDIIINFERLFTVNLQICKNQIKENINSHIINHNNNNLNNNNINVSNLKIDDVYLSKFLDSEDFDSQSVIEMRNSSSNNINSENGRDKNTFILKSPTGYQICDFKANSMFHILPINVMIEILVFSFLEIDMLFFSSNIEVLSIIMYAFALVSYPCTDSQYLWSISTISKEELKSGNNSLFLGKPFTSMLGVNSSFNTNIDTINFSNYHFIVDIDGKQIFFKSYESNKQEESIRKLFDFISSNYQKGTMFGSGRFLSQSLKNLYNLFETLCKKLVKKTRLPNTNKNIKDNETLYSDFFQEKGEIDKFDNSFIQYCYDFVLNLLIAYYNTFNISIDNETGEFIIKQDSILSGYSEEEKIFIDLIKNSFKNKSFFEDFIISRKCLDIYRIPYMLTEEFLIIKRKMKITRFYQIAFQIIDTYYKKYGGKVENFEMNFDNFNKFIMKNKQEGKASRSESEGAIEKTKEFSSSSHPKEKVNNTLFREFQNRLKYCNNIIKLQQTQTQYFLYKYIKFDNELLVEYKYCITNENLNDIFPTINKIKNFKVPSVQLTEISDFLERVIIANKNVESKDILIICYLMMSCLFIEKYGLEINNIKHFLQTLTFSQRRYIKMYQQVIIYILKKKRENKKEISLKELLPIIQMLNSYIIESKLIPDKLIMSNLKELYEITNKFCEEELKDNRNNININKINLTERKLSKDKNDKNNSDILENYSNTDNNCNNVSNKLIYKITFDNSPVKEQEKVIKQIFILSQNVIFNGEYDLINNSNNSEENKTSLNIYVNNKEVYVCKIYSPLKLYLILRKLIFKEFLNVYDLGKINKSNLLNSLCNLTFYLKYEENFKDLHIEKLYEVLLDYFNINEDK